MREWERLNRLELPDRVRLIVSSHPMTARNLVRYVRLQWPRIMPEAVEAAVLALLDSKFVELDGLKLRERA